MNRTGQSRKQFCADKQQHSFNDMLIYCCAVILVYNSETSNKGISLDDINRWYNTSVYQRSNKATKEWCNKQKHIGIRTLACKPARAPTCLPSSLPACRHTDRRTCRQAIRKRAGSNMMWKRYGIKSRTVLPIFISKMCNKCTIMIRCLIYSIFQRNNFGNEREKHYFCK